MRFLSTPSARRATPAPAGTRMVQLVFLSTPSARRATGESYHRGCRRDISIHALREEGDGNASKSTHTWRISIHALREEGDEQLYVGQGRGEVISIHALREEGDHFPTSRPYGGLQFLSTPSARRATLSVPVANRGINDFYPRPPRGW